MEGETQGESFKSIDIKEIIRNKNPKAARFIPGFVYKWLDRILHLKEINEILSKNWELKGIDFIDHTIEYLNIRTEFIGIENLPTHDRQIYVSNHPLGGLDGMIILSFLNHNVASTRTLTNDFLLNIKPLSYLFVPINKVGKQSRNSKILVDELYTSTDMVMMFPAGLCSRKIKGEIIDLEWQKHFVQKSIQHKLNVVPIYFEGTNTQFFYNLARFRKFLGLKLNIEMMFLSDEMFKHRNKTFKIFVGKEIPYTMFDKSKTVKEWAQFVKDETYKLPNKN